MDSGWGLPPYLQLEFDGSFKAATAELRTGWLLRGAIDIAPEGAPLWKTMATSRSRLDPLQLLGPKSAVNAELSALEIRHRLFDSCFEFLRPPLMKASRQPPWGILGARTRRGHLQRSPERVISNLNSYQLYQGALTDSVQTAAKAKRGKEGAFPAKLLPAADRQEAELPRLLFEAHPGGEEIHPSTKIPKDLGTPLQA